MAEPQDHSSPQSQEKPGLSGWLSAIGTTLFVVFGVTLAIIVLGLLALGCLLSNFPDVIG